MRNIDLIKQTNNSAGVARVKHIGVLEGNSSVDVLEILGTPFCHTFLDTGNIFRVSLGPDH